MNKLSFDNFDLWSDIGASLMDAYVSKKILQSDMKPMVRILAAIPWIIQGTVNTVNAVNKLTDSDYTTEDTAKQEEET